MFGHDDDYLDTLNQEELNKIIFDYALLDFETNFDRKYIPTWINEIFDNNLNLLPDETIPFSLFLAAFLPAMADLLSVNRIKVEMKNNGNLFPVNCYTIVVGDSSIGKGRVISLLNKTFNNVKCKGLYKDINGDIIINDQKFKSYGLEGKYKKLQQELLKKESEENEYTIGSKEYKQCKKNIEK